MLSGGTKICRLKPLQTASFSGAPLFVQMINLRDGMNQIFIFFPRLIQGLSWRMQQLVGQLDGQPFQNLFRRCAFGKLFHRIFQHLLARFLALVPQGLNQRNALPALLLPDKFGNLLGHQRFGGGGGFCLASLPLWTMLTISSTV